VAVVTTPVEGRWPMLPQQWKVVVVTTAVEGRWPLLPQQWKGGGRCYHSSGRKVAVVTSGRKVAIVVLG